MNEEPKLDTQALIDAIEKLISQLPEDFIGSLYDFEDSDDELTSKQ